MSRKQLVALVLLSFGALLIHGYHPFAEDAEIYLPGVEKMLDPGLFPAGENFFQSHASLTLFPDLIAASVRLSHLSLEWALLLWQWLSIFLLLLACWQLSSKCFAEATARWCGVALLAALLTLPVAGTSLYIFDQYVVPRNLCAFATVFAVALVPDRKYWQAALWLIFAGLVHPLMWFFAFVYCLLLVGMEKLSPASAFCVLLPLGISFRLPAPAYEEAVKLHPYFYIQSWAWYEWLGILGPIAILWWSARVARRRQLRNVERLCRTLIPYQLVFLAAALVLSSPVFGNLARLQPLRSLHLLYILMILIGGGFLGTFVLKNHLWRWILLFAPLCGGMFLAQRSLFSNSAHVECPGSASSNPWVQAFVWARQNTPRDATFALDPMHILIHGEDANGFRAIAQRNMLADAIKDSGAVSMFPPLADEWLKQFRAQTNWKHFQVQDFERLRSDYGVTWVILQAPGVTGLECPYRNSAVLVCKIAPGRP
ncbi:MAG: hypothetical protein DMG89_16160 [Acidobacteria bacterium]|nr:MAG: hypothetical protein DMG89_16160 [Acidobacteriota bacterium]